MEAHGRRLSGDLSGQLSPPQTRTYAPRAGCSSSASPDTCPPRGGCCDVAGVGRKTANLVLILAFGSERNICVDTQRPDCDRLGWVRTRTPDETERRSTARRRRGSGRTSICIWSHGTNVCRLSSRCQDACYAPFARASGHAGVEDGLAERVSLECQSQSSMKCPVTVTFLRDLRRQTRDLAERLLWSSIVADRGAVPVRAHARRPRPTARSSSRGPGFDRRGRNAKGTFALRRFPTTRRPRLSTC